MDFEKAFPLSEGIVESEQGNAGKNSNRLCLNCDTPLTDAYCPHCGQKDFPRRQDLGDLFINFISSFWSFESKFLQTGRLILFKPGHLPRDYNQGKRERYFHPARMYVFISFVYFLLLAVLPDTDNSNINATGEDREGFEYDKQVGDFGSAAEYDSIQQTLPIDERDSEFEQTLRRRFAKINEKYKDSGKSFNADFSELFFANTPRVFFILLPVFALVLYLLYARRDYFYSEHLVFTVFYYNFFFLAGSIYMLVNLIPVVREITWLIMIWIALYLLIAMKVSYQQSWGKTILKYSIFMVIFSFAVALGLLGNVIVTLIYL